MEYKKIILLLILISGLAYAANDCSQQLGSFSDKYELYRDKIDESIAASGLGNYNVENPNALVAAIISQESGWVPRPGDNGQSIGLMQINIKSHPECDTEKILASDDYENIKCGVNFLAKIERTYNVNTPKTYNCADNVHGKQREYSGIEAIMRYYNGWFPPGEDECKGDPKYVEHVESYYSKWAACLPATGNADYSLGSGTACSDPWGDYSCEQLTQDACSKEGYRPILGMCPTLPNDVQCCAPGEIIDAYKQAFGSVYGKCSGDTFSDNNCENLNDNGGQCTDTNSKAVPKHCPGASFIQCCVPNDKVEQATNSGEYTPATAATDDLPYQCEMVWDCVASGDSIPWPSPTCNYPLEQLCVPLDSFTQYTYVHDDASILDNEKEIADVLKGVDVASPEKMRAYVVMETRSGLYVNSREFNNLVKKRFNDLSMYAAQPSAIIFVVVNPLNSDKDHEVFIYSNSPPLQQAIQSMMNGPDVKIPLDNKNYGEALLVTANKISKYMVFYKEIIDNALGYEESGGCSDLKNFIVSIAASYDLDEAGKQKLVSDVSDAIDVACFSTWRENVRAELAGEIKRLNDKAKYLDQAAFALSSAVFSEDPSCAFTESEKYTCAKNPKAEYEIRQCKTEEKYQTKTNIGIYDGSECSPLLVLDGQSVPLDNAARCVGGSNGYSVAACSASGPQTYAWKIKNYNFAYDDQADCARDCSNNNADCAEPWLSMNAFDGRGQPIKDNMQDVDPNAGDIRINAYRLNKGDQHKNYNFKYRILRGATVLFDSSVKCTSSPCTLFLGPVRRGPGYEVQYWSEVSFTESNGATTYVRNPAVGVHSFKMAGISPGTATGITEQQGKPGQWVVIDNTKYPTTDTCRNSCKNNFGDDCIVKDGGYVPVDLVTANPITYQNAKNGAATAKQEIEGIQYLYNCYSEKTAQFVSGNRGMPEMPDTFLKCYENYFDIGQMTTYYPSSKPLAATDVYVPDGKNNVKISPVFSGPKDQIDQNARALFIKSIEKNYAYYDKTAERAACDIAYQVAETMNIQSILAEKKINAWNLAIEKCSKVKDLPGDAFAASKISFAKNAIGNVREPFTIGLMRSAEVLGEPMNFVFLAGGIAATAVMKVPAYAPAARVIQAAAEVYFTYQVSVGFGSSLGTCLSVGKADTAECGEATGNGLMLFGLGKALTKNGFAASSYLTEKGFISADGFFGKNRHIPSYKQVKNWVARLVPKGTATSSVLDPVTAWIKVERWAEIKNQLVTLNAERTSLMKDASFDAQAVASRLAENEKAIDALNVELKDLNAELISATTTAPSVLDAKINELKVTQQQLLKETPDGNTRELALLGEQLQILEGVRDGSFTGKIEQLRAGLASAAAELEKLQVQFKDASIKLDAVKNIDTLPRVQAKRLKGLKLDPEKLNAIIDYNQKRVEFVLKKLETDKAALKRYQKILDDFSKDAPLAEELSKKFDIDMRQETSRFQQVLEKYKERVRKDCPLLVPSLPAFATGRAVGCKPGSLNAKVSEDAPRFLDVAFAREASHALDKALEPEVKLPDKTGKEVRQRPMTAAERIERDAAARLSTQGSVVYENGLRRFLMPDETSISSVAERLKTEIYSVDVYRAIEDSKELGAALSDSSGTSVVMEAVKNLVPDVTPSDVAGNIDFKASLIGQGGSSTSFRFAFLLKGLQRSFVAKIGGIPIGDFLSQKILGEKGLVRRMLIEDPILLEKTGAKRARKIVIEGEVPGVSAQDAISKGNILSGIPDIEAMEYLRKNFGELDIFRDLPQDVSKIPYDQRLQITRELRSRITFSIGDLFGRWWKGLKVEAAPGEFEAFGLYDAHVQNINVFVRDGRIVAEFTDPLHPSVTNINAIAINRVPVGDRATYTDLLTEGEINSATGGQVYPTRLNFENFVRRAAGVTDSTTDLAVGPGYDLAPAARDLYYDHFMRDLLDGMTSGDNLGNPAETAGLLYKLRARLVAQTQQLSALGETDLASRNREFIRDIDDVLSNERYYGMTPELDLDLGAQP